MSKIEKVRSKVHELYASQNPNRDEWTDWLYESHVLVVAKYARELAKKYQANEDFSEAAALLHDIADVKLARINKDHESESLNIARHILSDSGFSKDEIALIVEDAIQFHSCHDGKKPKSKEGLILATADALAHFKTGYYAHAAWSFGKDRSLEELKEWVIKKIDRDLFEKISFEEERKASKLEYEAIKMLFSR